MRPAPAYIRFDGEVEDPDHQGQDEDEPEAAQLETQLFDEIADVVGVENPRQQPRRRRIGREAEGARAVAAAGDEMPPREKTADPEEDQEQCRRGDGRGEHAARQAERLHAVRSRPGRHDLEEDRAPAIGGGLQPYGNVGPLGIRSFPGRARIAIERGRPLGRHRTEARGIEPGLGEEGAPIGRRSRPTRGLDLWRDGVEAQ